MIDLELAEKKFKEFLKDFDIKQDKIRLKIVHTYHVVELSEYIAKNLNLSKEDVELAKLIALLHDIGRFGQLKKYNDFSDHKTIDHAEAGIELLFKENKIRDFIQDCKYDQIIYKAIQNHNKLEIQKGLNEKELLHAKIIRDADKADHFRTTLEEDLEVLLHPWNKGKIENGVITEKIFKDFLDNKIIINEERKTPIDYWISYIAYIFDFNYKIGLKYIIEKDYINKNIDKIDYKNAETKQKMEIVRNHALEFIKKSLS